MNDKSSAKVYTAIAGIVILLIINAFIAKYFTNPFNVNDGIDMDNLARYTVSKTNLMYDDIPAVRNHAEIINTFFSLKYWKNHCFLT